MKHYSRFARFSSKGVASLIVASAAFVGSAGLTSAQQEPSPANTSTSKRSNNAGRDPFRKFDPPKIVVRKSNLLMPPSIEERIAQYRAQKQAAMSARIQAPKPTTAILLSETQVVGITRTPRGYAAIVEATPIKMSFVIYPGERFFDGQLVAIDDNRLIFRRELVFVDGRREKSVETKPLRQPTSIDIFSAAKAATAAPEVSQAESKPAPEKP